MSSLRFDIEIVRVCPRAPRAGVLPFDPFWSHLGFAGADLSLSDARLLASAIRAAGGAGLIIPSVYRTSLVSIEAARRIAEQRLEVLRLQQRGGSFGLLEDGETHAMWWRFYVNRWSPFGDDPESELIAIDVDLIDGHIATPADERQLAEWQQDMPCSWPAEPEGPLSRRQAAPRRTSSLVRVERR